MFVFDCYSRHKVTYRGRFVNRPYSSIKTQPYTFAIYRAMHRVVGANHDSP